MAASAFAGTTFRATKSSQFLNGLLARASTMALARCGPIFGSVSSSVAVAVFRLIFLTIGVVATGVGAALAGATTAGAAGCAGAATCAKAGAALSARNAATESRRRRFIGVVLGIRQEFPAMCGCRFGGHIDDTAFDLQASHYK